MTEHEPQRDKTSASKTGERMLARRASEGTIAVLLVALLVLLLGPCATPARAGIVFGDIDITPDPMPAGTASHGYVEYGFTLTNRSKERPHRVTLTLPKSKDNPRSHHIRSITRTVDVSPGATVHITLLQPFTPVLMGNNLEVSIDGRTQEDTIPFSPIQTRSLGTMYGYTSTPVYTPGMVHGSSSGMMNQPLLLISRGVPPEFQGQASAGRHVPILDPPDPPDPAPPAIPPGIRPPLKSPAAVHPVGFTLTRGAQIARPEMPLTNWSTNWLGYSRYDGVVVTGDDVRTMPSAVRTALWHYVEGGGTLLLLGEATLPETWKRRERRLEGLTVYDAGFGQCLLAPDTAFGNWSNERWVELDKAWNQTAEPWQRVRSAPDANLSFPVVDSIEVPVKGLFILMLLFTAVIGPLNLVVLARQKRRIWMLWTVPLIAFVTCVAVFGYMLLAEGWRGHLRTEGITFLDEVSHRAATIGFTAFYTPFVSGDGLHFSPETELVAQTEERRSWREQKGTARTLDWTHDQHLTSGWVSARVPAHFMVRKCETRRERVTFSKEKDDTLALVNGLGAGIDKIWYADAQGRIWSAARIAEGQRSLLQPTGDTLAKPGAKAEGDRPPLPVAAGEGAAPYRLRDVYRGDWVSSQGVMPTRPGQLLVPGSYLAVLNAAPFLEDGMKNVKTRTCRSVVYGLTREPGHED